MEENLLPYLEANKVKLENLLKEYDYLNKSHNQLTKSIKENIEMTNKFFNESGSIVDSISIMTTSAREDMIALNKAMSKQIILVESINKATDEMSQRYQLSKEEVASTIELLKERAEITEKIAQINRQNPTQEETEMFNKLNKSLHKVNGRIKQIGVGANKMLSAFDSNDDSIIKLCKDTEELKVRTEEVTNAQNQYNESMQDAIDKAEKFKKSGWFDILSTGWNVLKTTTSKGIDKWLEVDQAGRDFGRSVGMTGEQLNKHISGIYDKYGSMAKKLGMEFKDIYKFQTGYVEATEKSVILTTEQVTTMAALSRNTGDQAVTVASKNLDVFTTSADAAIDYLAKGTARAALEGLNVKKYSDAFANNIKLASKYTFKEGISGIQKMTLLSQRLKFNMESIGAAMDKFSTIEGAIDAGSKLQVLGGAFAQNFGNPLEAMSEALLDGEAFTKRIINTVTLSAKFNAKTGEIDLSPIDKQRLKSAAEAMGISYDELHNMATQSRKSSMISKVVSGKGLNESQEAYLTNKAQYNKATRKWHLTDVNGEMMKKDISQMSAEEIDKARGADSYEKIISSDIKGIHQLIQGKGNSELSKIETIRGYEENIAFNVAKLVDDLPTMFQWVIAAISASQLFGSIGSLGGRLLGRGTKNVFNSISKYGGSMAGLFGVKAASSYIGKNGRIYNSNGIASRQNWINKANSLKNSSKLLKGFGGLATAALGAYETYSALSDYNSSKKQILDSSELSNIEKAKSLNDAKKTRNKNIGGTIGATALSLLSLGLAGTGVGIPLAIGLGYLGHHLGSMAGGALTENVDETMKEINKNGSLSSNYNRKEYFMNSTRGNLNNEQKITVSDMKLHVDGKIELVASSISNMVDVNVLLKDRVFQRGIIDIIRTNINNKLGNGTVAEMFTV